MSLLYVFKIPVGTDKYLLSELDPQNIGYSVDTRTVVMKMNHNKLQKIGLSKSDLRNNHGISYSQLLVQLNTPLRFSKDKYHISEDDILITKDGVLTPTNIGYDERTYNGKISMMNLLIEDDDIHSDGLACVYDEKSNEIKFVKGFQPSGVDVNFVDKGEGVLKLALQPNSLEPDFRSKLDRISDLSNSIGNYTLLNKHKQHVDMSDGEKILINSNREDKIRYTLDLSKAKNEDRSVNIVSSDDSLDEVILTSDSKFVVTESDPVMGKRFVTVDDPINTVSLFSPEDQIKSISSPQVFDINGVGYFNMYITYDEINHDISLKAKKGESFFKDQTLWFYHTAKQINLTVEGDYQSNADEYLWIVGEYKDVGSKIEAVEYIKLIENRSSKDLSTLSYYNKEHVKALFKPTIMFVVFDRKSEQWIVYSNDVSCEIYNDPIPGRVSVVNHNTHDNSQHSSHFNPDRNTEILYVNCGDKHIDNGSIADQLLEGIEVYDSTNGIRVDEDQSTHRLNISYDKTSKYEFRIPTKSLNGTPGYLIVDDGVRYTGDSVLIINVEDDGSGHHIFHIPNYGFGLHNINFTLSTVSDNIFDIQNNDRRTNTVQLDLYVSFNDQHPETYNVFFSSSTHDRPIQTDPQNRFPIVSNNSIKIWLISKYVSLGDQVKLTDNGGNIVVDGIIDNNNLIIYNGYKLAYFVYTPTLDMPDERFKSIYHLNVTMINGGSISKDIRVLNYKKISKFEDVDILSKHTIDGTDIISKETSIKSRITLPGNDILFNNGKLWIEDSKGNKLSKDVIVIPRIKSYDVKSFGLDIARQYNMFFIFEDVFGMRYNIKKVVSVSTTPIYVEQVTDENVNLVKVPFSISDKCKFTSNGYKRYTMIGDECIVKFDLPNDVLRSNRSVLSLYDGNEKISEDVLVGPASKSLELKTNKLEDNKRYNLRYKIYTPEGLELDHNLFSILCLFNKPSIVTSMYKIIDSSNGYEVNEKDGSYPLFDNKNKMGLYKIVFDFSNNISDKWIEFTDSSGMLKLFHIGVNEDFDFVIPYHNNNDLSFRILLGSDPNIRPEDDLSSPNKTISLIRTSVDECDVVVKVLSLMKHIDDRFGYNYSDILNVAGYKNKIRFVTDKISVGDVIRIYLGNDKSSIELVYSKTVDLSTLETDPNTGDAFFEDYITIPKGLEYKEVVLRTEIISGVYGNIYNDNVFNAKHSCLPEHYVSKPISLDSEKIDLLYDNDTDNVVVLKLDESIVEEASKGDYGIVSHLVDRSDIKDGVVSTPTSGMVNKEIRSLKDHLTSHDRTLFGVNNHNRFLVDGLNIGGGVLGIEDDRMNTLSEVDINISTNADNLVFDRRNEIQLDKDTDTLSIDNDSEISFQLLMNKFKIFQNEDIFNNSNIELLNGDIIKTSFTYKNENHHSSFDTSASMDSIPITPFSDFVRHFYITDDYINYSDFVGFEKVFHMISNSIKWRTFVSFKKSSNTTGIIRVESISSKSNGYNIFTSETEVGNITGKLDLRIVNINNQIEALYKSEVHNNPGIMYKHNKRTSLISDDGMVRRSLSDNLAGIEPVVYKFISDESVVKIVDHTTMYIETEEWEDVSVNVEIISSNKKHLRIIEPLGKRISKKFLINTGELSIQNKPLLWLTKDTHSLDIDTDKEQLSYDLGIIFSYKPDEESTMNMLRELQKHNISNIISGDSFVIHESLSKFVICLNDVIYTYDKLSKRLDILDRPFDDIVVVENGIILKYGKNIHFYCVDTLVEIKKINLTFDSFRLIKHQDGFIILRTERDYVEFITDIDLMDVVKIHTPITTDRISFVETDYGTNVLTNHSSYFLGDNNVVIESKVSCMDSSNVVEVGYTIFGTVAYKTSSNEIFYSKKLYQFIQPLVNEINLVRFNSLRVGWNKN